jgi:hypothetical protein
MDAPLDDRRIVGGIPPHAPLTVERCEVGVDEGVGRGQELSEPLAALEDLIPDPEAEARRLWMATSTSGPVQTLTELAKRVS